ncbi:hypothetical protein GCM10023165_42820 [Variovorax defluvii]|uniref:Lipoprotein n=1 Tax=Variovorax defluvii TaxID=913761 RepID=A0ABP8I7X2_9BURK
MRGSWNLAAGLMVLALGLAGCKSNGANTASAPAGSVSITAAGVPVPGTAIQPQPVDKTAEFLGAFRPKEQQ